MAVKKDLTNRRHFEILYVLRKTSEDMEQMMTIEYTNFQKSLKKGNWARQISDGREVQVIEIIRFEVRMARIKEFQGGLDDYNVETVPLEELNTLTNMQIGDRVGTPRGEATIKGDAQYGPCNTLVVDIEFDNELGTIYENEVEGLIALD